MVEGQSIIVQPPSELQDMALILSIILCFVLVTLSIYFAVTGSASSGAFSLIGAAFFVFVIFAIKGR
ncbi:MAG: hypothetical protein FE043_03735 [Thermoplasmata archaeon]|nr:MAG: hypothetical protein FE043_03735 [Thermoplasmata archaeon]